MVIVIIVAILIIIAIIKYKTKFFKLNNVVLINGGIKSGKTSLTVYLAIKQHKIAHFKWWFRKYFLFKKNEEEPLLYSNVPIKYKYYIPFSSDILLRNKRVAYKSVCLLSEASLVADSQSYKDSNLNYETMLFCKLYAHETKGGYLFIETQSISDLHYSFKRVLNNYLYIHSCFKLIPFILVFKVRELMYSYDNESIVNNFDSDIEDSLKTLVITKGIWKKFDCYTYSSFTDDLNYDCVVLTKDDIEKLDLKSKDIVTFIKYKDLKKGGVKHE